MRRRSMPTAGALALAALPCLIACVASASPPRVRPLRPLWADPASAPTTEAGDLSAIVTRSLVTDPLDASWIGMPLPSLHNLVAPSGVEFAGKLVLAGAFGSAGSIVAPSIVSWDGSQFGSMGNPGMRAQSLVIWNGVLYAGGAAFGINSVIVSRWDGASWTPVGVGPASPSTGPIITCMEVFNNELVVSGYFTGMGGVAADRVARFDGTSWHAMGSVGARPFFDLQTVGGSLYAGAYQAGGVLRWDGSSWVVVGPGLSAPASSLATDGTSLYAAGQFSKAGPDSVPGVAKWDGSQWHRVGVGTTANVGAILWWNGQLVASVTDGSSPVSRFDGTNWSGLGGPWTGNYLSGLVGFGPKLVGLGVVPSDASPGAMYDGSTWAPIREPWTPDMTGIDREAYGATVWNDRLVLVGTFAGVADGTGMLASAYEAMWDGSTWSTFGTGTGAGVQGLCAAPWGSMLAVAGFVSRGIIPGDRGVALWNGSAWVLPGSSTYPYAYALADHLGELYAGGDFEYGFGTPTVTVNHVERWNGTTWSALGSGLEALSPTINYPSCFALASWGDLVVAGGEFDHAGGQPAANIAAWDGAAWSSLGAGLDLDCYALTVWNGKLVAGGDFTHAGGLAAPGAAMWDGATWQPMGDNAVSVDDFAQISGTLYAVGAFRSPEGSTVTTVARWVGDHWQLLGSGGAGLVWVEGYHGDLYAGGPISYAFGKVTAGIVRLPAANTVSVDNGPVVASLALAASPNPGRRTTTFVFAMPTRGRARLAVYDAGGREVARLLAGDVIAGRHEVQWTAPARPGVYFAKLDAPGGASRVARVVRFE